MAGSAARVRVSGSRGTNPRYPKLQGIMQAKKKPIEDVTPAEWTDRVEIVSLERPPVKSAGKIIGTDASRPRSS